MNRLDSGVPRAIQSCCLRAVRHHDGKGRIEPVLGDGVDDGLKVAAAPGNQNGEAAAHECT